MNDELEYWEAEAAKDPLFAAWAEVGDGVDECLPWIAEVLPDLPGAVLDLGCGPGRLLAPLAMGNPRVDFIGVDISPRMLGAARRVCPRNVSLVEGDGRTIPVAVPLRMAYSVLVFQHLPDDAVQGYLAQISDLLVPGGVLVFQYVSGTDDHFLNHHRRADTVERWCEDVGLKPAGHALGSKGHYQWNWIQAVKP